METPLEDPGELGASEKAADTSGSFSEVRRKKKRARGADMDTSEGATGGEQEGSSVKRPAFPPVNVSTSLVSFRYTLQGKE